MNKKAKNLKENEKIIDEYDYLANAATSMDCTGLIPSAPKSSDELQSYQEIYQHGSPIGRGKILGDDQLR